MDLRGESAQSLNEEQKTAIVNIVQCKNGQIPYILDGPPGTGKTRVIVASIEEIIRDTQKQNFVLVCSSSNSACDEIFGRLLTIFDCNEIFRLYTVSHERKKVEERYIKFCNWDEETKAFTMPDLKYLYSQRVIICTLAVAGNLVRANGNVAFKPDHFSHVIIDECASTHETLTMVPIAGEIIILQFIQNFPIMVFANNLEFQAYAQFTMKSKPVSCWLETQSS